METKRVGEVSHDDKEGRGSVAWQVLGVLYALLGLIFGALFALISLLGAAVGAANSQSSDAFAGLLFGVGSVIFLPIFYGTLGFIFGLIGACSTMA